MTYLLFLPGWPHSLWVPTCWCGGASRLALSLGISPLVAGLTVVAFGTSAPKVAVSVDAVLDGKTDRALGNVVGSNIFNALGCMGIASLVSGNGGLLVPAGNAPFSWAITWPSPATWSWQPNNTRLWVCFQRPC